VSLSIRAAEISDLRAIGPLLIQLGYSAAQEDLAGRFEALFADPQANVLVATDGHALLGLATTYLVPVAHEAGPWYRLTALVVDERQRGRGVGQALIKTAEAIARDAGCSRIEATSASHRADAHSFYRHLGYAREADHFLKRFT
jgi:GNAT superfamily N-acetyltransferase